MSWGRRLSPFVLAFAAAPAVAQLEWTPLHPIAHPDGRSHGAIAWDSARSRAVLFSGYQHLNETWEWDGATWTRRQPRTRPPERLIDQMVFDAARGRCLFFGGPDFGQGPSSDTWEWDGTDWTRRQIAGSPSPRWDHALAYDSLRGVTVLFGGAGAAGSLGETWEFDGTTWTQRFPAQSPLPRERCCLAYDAGRRRTVMFGGWSALAGALGDTWEWDGANWTPVQPLTTSPPGRFDFAMTYDPRRGRTILFGGQSTIGYANDVWEWDGVDWAAVTPAQSPAVRYGHMMTYDSSCGRTLLFGGADDMASTYSDTWALAVPPSVSSVLPSTGAESGGDLVTIRGVGFPDSVDVAVFFGGAAAVVHDVACGRLVVTSPPGAGLADVTVQSSLGSVTVPQAFAYAPDAIAARFGNVGVALGERESVILANGSGGDASRELSLPTGQPLTLFVSAPSSRSSATFVLYGWLGAPDASTLVTLPRGLGTMVFPTPFAGAAPQPRAVWNNVGRAAVLGAPTLPSSAAPTVLARRPHGVPVPVVATLQGLIRDDASGSADGYSVTNAIVLRIGP
jgi:IPT/TIG domain-containing protein